MAATNSSEPEVT